MGLLLLRGFSSIPNSFEKIRSKREQKERYSPTWFEWAVKNVPNISRVHTVTNGSFVLFTVPEGSILYITGVQISTSAGGGRLTVAPNGALEGIDGRILSISDVGAVALNLSKPFKVVGGNEIRIVSGGVNNIVGGFHGFVVEGNSEIV